MKSTMYVIKQKTFMTAPEKWRKPPIAEWRLETDQKMSTERMVVAFIQFLL